MSASRLAVAALLGLAACTQTVATTASTAIEPPACTAVSRFGNGQACGAQDPTLASCGTSDARLCADGWLCYDAVDFEQCACQVDADCAGKRAYVNTARSLNNKSPILISCRGNRCVEGN